MSAGPTPPGGDRARSRPDSSALEAAQRVGPARVRQRVEPRRGRPGEGDPAAHRTRTATSRRRPPPGIPTTTIAPLQRRIVAGLDGLYGMVDVAATQAFSFGAADPPVSIADDRPRPGRRAVRARRGEPRGLPRRPQGEEGVAHPQDRRQHRVAQGRQPEVPRGRRAGPPHPRQRRTSSGGGGAVDKKGNGTLARVKVADATDWGKDIRGDRDVPPQRRRGPLQPLRRRPVREADPPLLAGRGRERLPGRRHRLPRRAAGRLDDRPSCTSTATSGDRRDGAITRFVGGQRAKTRSPIRATSSSGRHRVRPTSPATAARARASSTR